MQDRPKDQRYCPHPACAVAIASVRFCCARHWYQLSWEDRRRINYAWDKWRQGYISLAGLRKAQQEVIDKWMQPKSAAPSDN